jgi:hypothetical protein
VLERCIRAVEEARALLAAIETVPLDPDADPGDVRARRQVRARSELIARAASLLQEAQALLDDWQSTPP